jgi:glycosyltransferase involved in cell wall biosynthesis
VRRCEPSPSAGDHFAGIANLAAKPGSDMSARDHPRDDSALTVAYLVNHYPKVSHTFIRREIIELERQGIHVHRFALRGHEGELPDEQDRQERAKTRYLLRGGVVGLLLDALRVAVTRPRRMLAALRLALAMAHRADRPLPYHLYYLAEASRLYLWLRARRVRHLHAHFGTNPAEVAMLAHALGGPAYSFTVHGPEEFDKAAALGLRTKVERAAFVVAVSSFGRSQLFRVVDAVHWYKIRVVHCGLEVDFHAHAHTSVPAAPRLVCVGRLCEQKGQLLLLEAVRRLLERGADVELVLAGDGEMRATIEQTIARDALGKAVRITGWIDSHQVREQILSARALVLPSFAEGLPVVLMEAMVLGRPVLTTYVAGIPELVRHGENGWLVPAGDVDALTEALAQAIAATPAELERMGAAGRRRVLQRHAIATEVAGLAAAMAQHIHREVV